MKFKYKLTLHPGGALRAKAGFDAELMIYGDIGENWWAPEQSVAARDVVSQLSEMGANDSTTLLVHLNSYGGSVTDGAAIYNALRSFAGDVTVRIEGIAASVASVIAMAGDTVEMAANALLMIHAPWSMVAGNSAELREAADVLDTFAGAMSTSYARKSGRTATEELAQLTDGLDHWYSASDAKAAKYVDSILEDASAGDDASARLEPMIAAMARYRTAPTAIAAAMRPHFNAAITARAPLIQPEAKPAASAATSRSNKMNFIALALALGMTLAANADEAAAKLAVMKELGLAETADDATVQAALARRNKPATAQPEAAADRAREIESMFAIAARSRATDTALPLMRDRLLVDTSVTAAQARADLSRYLGQVNAGLTPTAGASSVDAGDDQADKTRAAMTQSILARVGKAKMESANPFRGFRLGDLARASLEGNGFNLKGRSPIDIATMALGGKVNAAGSGGAQTTSDFPVILENTLHKILLEAYGQITLTWSAWCKVMDVSDFRNWNVLVPAFIGNLDGVDETGEYKSKIIPDATKNQINVTRRGNIIQITPEVIVNDDTGYIVSTAAALGQAGGRTIERAVYSVLLSNPILSDGNALFSAAHGNLAATGTVPNAAAINAGVVAMSTQPLPGDPTDFMDVNPTMALTSKANEGPLRQIIASPYDPDATSKLQRPNIVYNVVEKIWGTPRLPGYPWYLFADPSVAPVIAVAFLDGQREPNLTLDEEFRTGGIRWRAELPFGVSAIDWRGGYLNPGAAPQ